MPKIITKSSITKFESDSFIINRNETYNKQLDLDDSIWFNWKFQKCPTGKANLSLLTDKEEIFGCNAFGPLSDIHFSGDKHSIWLSLENFIHPNYQRKGYFHQLLTNSEKLLSVDSNTIMMSFPNDKSIKAYKNNDWIHRSNYINHWVKFNLTQNLLLHFIDLKKEFKSIGIKPLNCTLTSMNLIHFKNVVTTYWSTKLLNWRFNEYPQSYYQTIILNDIEGVIRLGKRGRLNEAQILFLNDKTNSLKRNTLILWINELKKQIKVDLITFPTSKDNPFTKILKTIGFVQLRSRANFIFKSNSIQTNTKFSISGIDFHTY